MSPQNHRFGDIPFDLKSFFENIRQLETDRTDDELNQIFSNQFMPAVRARAAHAMGKKSRSRPQLRRVVGEACFDYWGKMTDKPFPFTDVHKKGKSQLGLDAIQNSKLIGNSIETPEMLIDFLQQEDEMPLPATPSPSKNRVWGDSTPTPTADGVPKAQQSLTAPGIPISQLSVRRDESATAEERGRKSKSTTDDSTSELDSSTDSGTDSQDRAFGVGSLGDFDNWAIPVPGQPNIYREAPKLPVCGPWEIPLPQVMDLRIHVEPHLKEVQLLLGGVRITPHLMPARIFVSLSAVQRGQVLMDQSQYRTVEKDLTALRWKAFRVLLAWAEHLKKRAKPPADKPMDMLEFVRFRLHRDGERAKDSVLYKVSKHSRKGGTLFPGREYQMPKMPDLTASQSSTMTPRSYGDGSEEITCEENDNERNAEKRRRSDSDVQVVGPPIKKEKMDS